MIFGIILLMIVSFVFGGVQSKKAVVKRLQKISDESDNNGERFYDRVYNEFELKYEKNNTI